MRTDGWVRERPALGDVLLLMAIGILLLLGLIMVYSASQLAVPDDPSYWFRRQALWAMVGAAALLVCARVDYHVWRRVAFPAMLLCLVLLVLVLWRGESLYGAQRWLDLGITFQPSELVKLTLTLYVADWLVRKGDEVRSALYGLLPFGLLVGGVLGLILLENDLGTTLVVALLALAIFLSAGGESAPARASARARAAGSVPARRRLQLSPCPAGCLPEFAAAGVRRGGIVPGVPGPDLARLGWRARSRSGR